MCFVFVSRQMMEGKELPLLQSKRQLHYELLTYLQYLTILYLAPSIAVEFEEPSRLPH